MKIELPREMFLLHTLSLRMQEIFIMRHNHTLQQVGDCFGRHRETIRQLDRRSHYKLRKAVRELKASVYYQSHFRPKNQGGREAVKALKKALSLDKERDDEKLSSFVTSCPRRSTYNRQWVLDKS